MYDLLGFRPINVICKQNQKRRDRQEKIQDGKNDRREDGFFQVVPVVTPKT
jgi:hypothetical protein